jgi:uncharacterized protein (DUF1697 family)
VTRVALLRAINAGITLQMSDLRRIAAELGLAAPRTYIASGNLLFDGHLPDAEVKQLLELRLTEHTGKPVTLTLRTAEELAAVAAANPFPDAPGNRVYATFLDTAPPPDVLTNHKHRTVEQIALGTREIYVHYPEGMGRSRLVIPAASVGTARNMNTVAKLADLASAKTNR